MRETLYNRSLPSREASRLVVRVSLWEKGIRFIPRTFLPTRSTTSIQLTSLIRKSVFLAGFFYDAMYLRITLQFWTSMYLLTVRNSDVVLRSILCFPSLKKYNVYSIVYSIVYMYNLFNWSKSLKFQKEFWSTR